MRSVLARVLHVAAMGTGIGVTAGVAGSHFMRSLVVEIDPADPWVFGIAAGTVIAIAMIAGWLPARAAGRTDPVQVLAAET